TLPATAAATVAADAGSVPTATVMNPTPTPGVSTGIGWLDVLISDTREGGMLRTIVGIVGAVLLAIIALAASIMYSRARR
ncbi:MAG: hypothetical protein KDE54_16515, partial [Caldilineaceae bacterium]|nr:hypothetical protein [Caldilineaceae bacterium]